MATIRRSVDQKSLRGLSAETQAKLDALGSKGVEANAQTDPDNPPLTTEELERGVFGRTVRRAREKLGLSQKEFAHRFAINLRRLQDWEQGRSAPDSAISAYIKIIEREPELVRRILEPV